MIRQRLRLDLKASDGVAMLVMCLFALALIWYGLMVFLLAVKVPPHAVNSLSAYRTIFNWLARLTPREVGHEPQRWIIALCALAGFLLFALLAFAAVPRAHLARHALALEDEQAGTTSVGPRALERLAEVAIAQEPAIGAATARYGNNELAVNVTVRRAVGIDDILRRAQARASKALEQHDLPSIPLNVTLAGYDRRQRRELN